MSCAHRFAEDIDLEKGTLRVSRNITAQRKFTTPKNKKSTRTVFLLKPAIEALMKQREFYVSKKATGNFG